MMKNKYYFISAALALAGLFVWLVPVQKAEAGYYKEVPWADQCMNNYQVNYEFSTDGMSPEEALNAYLGAANAPLFLTVHEWDTSEANPYMAKAYKRSYPFEGDLYWCRSYEGKNPFYYDGSMEVITTYYLEQGSLPDTYRVSHYTVERTIELIDKVYIPTPPRMDILVNGQSPTGQVAKTGTRPTYGYATGCWRWKWNGGWVLDPSTSYSRCNFNTGGYWMYTYGQTGSETYTYYVTAKVPLELRTGDQLTVSWTLTRGQNTDDRVRTDQWANVTNPRPGGRDYTGSRTITLTDPGLLTFALTATNEDGEAADTEQVNVIGSPVTTTTTTLPPTTTATLAPTLNTDLSANPTSGPAPLTSTLTASVSGTATGTINYSFWWNCNYTGTSVATAISQCGDPDGASGNANGNKYDGITANPKSSIPHIYSSVGTYTAKVIVERGPLAAEDRDTITVTRGDPEVCLQNCGGGGTTTTTLPGGGGPPSGGYGVFPGDYCSSITATVTWRYSDPNGDPQSAYRVQIDEAGNSFASPVLDTGKILSSSNSYSIGAGVLQFNVTYKARVVVWDSNDTPSCPTPGSCGEVSDNWKTPKHAYPQVNFTWVPLSPNANQSVQFTDQTTFYDSGSNGQRKWSWTFGDGGSSNQQNPSHTYSVINNYNAALTAEDKDKYSCSNTKTISIKKAVPIWKEIAPKE